MRIKLTKGLFAIIDPEDGEYLSQFEWVASKSKHTSYALMRTTIRGKKSTLPMHRVILRALPWELCDHINGNGLDNRRSNLRLCTESQNNCNKRILKTNKTSRFRGVYFYPKTKTWAARIGLNRKQKFLGYFKSETQAAQAYDKAAREIHGEYAKFNF